MGVSVALEARDGRIGQGGDVVAGPDLTAVGVAGQLEVDAVPHGIVDQDGLVREQHGRERARVSGSGWWPPI